MEWRWGCHAGLLAVCPAGDGGPQVLSRAAIECAGQPGQGSAPLSRCCTKPWASPWKSKDGGFALVGAPNWAAADACWPCWVSRRCQLHAQGPHPNPSTAQRGSLSDHQLASSQRTRHLPPSAALSSARPGPSPALQGYLAQQSWIASRHAARRARVSRGGRSDQAAPPGAAQNSARFFPPPRLRCKWATFRLDYPRACVRQRATNPRLPATSPCCLQSSSRLPSLTLASPRPTRPRWEQGGAPAGAGAQTASGGGIMP